MKKCNMCGKVKSISEMGTYQNGNPKTRCKKCCSTASMISRNKKRQGNRVEPDFTESRHPDPDVMEENVQRLIKMYAENEARIEQANLCFEPEAGLCDIIIANPCQP